MDSITHLALWKAKMPEGKMGVRKAMTLLLLLTCPKGPHLGTWVREAKDAANCE